MEEIAQFQSRLRSLNESLDGRNIEDVGTVELTSLREALTNLLGEVDSHIRECRLDTEKFDDEETAEILFSGLRARNQIRNLRSEVVSELLLKESKIDSLHREEEQILGLESSLSGFTVADELNMTDVERAVMNLSSTFPKRKEEIVKELDELKNGRTPKKENKEEKTREGGAHLSKEEKEEEEEVNNSIDGVDFGEPEKNEEDGLLTPPSEIKEEGEEGLLTPPPERKEEGEDGLLTPPPERKEETTTVAPMLGVTGDELDPVPEEKEDKEEPIIAAATDGTPKEEEDDEYSRIPIPVTEIVQPKPSLWQKVGLAITGAIGFMATAIAVHTGLGARYLKDLANNNEATVQEEVTPEETEVTPEEPATEEEVVANVVDTVQQNVTPEIPPEPAAPEPEPVPQPEPAPEPEPAPQPQEEEIPIYLDPGESVYDTTTGVEVTSTGESYVHEDGNTAPIETRTLEYTDDGAAIVHSSDFAYDGPAPEEVPAPVAEAPLLVDESKVESAEQHLAELQQQGNLEEAEDFSNAMDAIDWDSILGSGPSLN